MPAKLDLTKPLRLIGIQIYEGTHENMRKVLMPGWYPFIKCKNTDKMGTSKTTLPLVARGDGGQVPVPMHISNKLHGDNLVSTKKVPAE